MTEPAVKGGKPKCAWCERPAVVWRNDGKGACGEHHQWLAGELKP